MTDPDRPRREPEVNISGDTPDATDLPDEGDGPTTRAAAVVDRLGELYWRKRYGGKDAFPCLLRTILSQNTSDAASQPAFDDLMERYDGDDDLAARLADADADSLAGTIESAGLYNQKAAVIVDAARRIVEEWGSADAFDEYVGTAPHDEVRQTLLGFDGVGPKTADCVLLFAAGRDGVFPVDTHVHRIARRLGIAPLDADHEGVRRALEAAVPPERCGFGHTAMIQFGREVCTAAAPACLDGPEACPMADLCDRVGVDPEAGTVRDPAAAAEDG